MPYFAKEHVDNIMFTCCVLHNILLDHDAREWTEQDDLDVFNLPSARDSSAAYNPTDYSYMNGSDNNIPVDECEAEGSWGRLFVLFQSRTSSMPSATTSCSG
jgi:hypothetical protein